MSIAPDFLRADAEAYDASASALLSAPPPVRGQVVITHSFMTRFTRSLGSSLHSPLRFTLRSPAPLLACVAGLVLGLSACAQTASSSGAMAQTAGVPIAASAAATPSVVLLSDAQFKERAAAQDAEQSVLDARTKQNNYVYAVAEHNCYSHFFVNHCLSVARDKMRDEKSKIRDAQLALSAERRSDREQKRTLDDSAKQAETLKQAPQRSANEKRHREAFAAKQRQHQLDQAKRGQDAAQRAVNVAAYNQKQAAHQQALAQARRDAAADAAKRAENVQRYNAKQDAAKVREKQLADRRAKAKARAASSTASGSSQ